MEEYWLEIQEEYDRKESLRMAKKFFDKKNFGCCGNGACIGNHKVAAKRGLVRKAGKKSKLTK